MATITANKLNSNLFLPAEETANLSTHLFSEDRGYYRSKVFTSSIGINPLIAAASPLFSLAGFITEDRSSIDAYLLYQDLQHEIKAFENQARQHRYRSEMILVTRYLLCAFLDELISNAFFSYREEKWEPYSLLKFFHQEVSGDERFFLILERASRDPEIHLDLLEFIYLCFSFGYVGKYRHDPEGKERIEDIRSRLFECIRAHRGDLKKELHIQAKEEVRPTLTKMQFPLWLVASFTIALLLTIYSSFSYMLGATAETVYDQIYSVMN